MASLALHICDLSIISVFVYFIIFLFSRGPHSLTLKNTDSPKLQVSNLKVGQYKFRLTCWDKEKLHDLDTMQLTVQESRNQRPKAHAGTRMTYYSYKILSIGGKGFSPPNLHS